MYFENVTTLGEIVLGVHRTVSLIAETELINDVQLLLGVFSTDTVAPPVTWVTFDPFVVQPDEFKVILVVSEEDPINVSGGVNVAAPVTVAAGDAATRQPVGAARAATRRCQRRNKTERSHHTHCPDQLVSHGFSGPFRNRRAGRRSPNTSRGHFVTGQS